TLDLNKSDHLDILRAMIKISNEYVQCEIDNIDVHPELWRVSSDLNCFMQIIVFYFGIDTLSFRSEGSLNDFEEFIELHEFYDYEPDEPLVAFSAILERLENYIVGEYNDLPYGEQQQMDVERDEALREIMPVTPDELREKIEEDVRLIHQNTRRSGLEEKVP